MIKFLKTVCIFLVSFTTLVSQESGSLMLGVGTSITGVRISEIMINPAFGYFATDNVMIGGNISYVGTVSEGYSWILLTGRYYVPGELITNNSRVFGELSYGTAFSGTSSQFWVGTGMTIRLGSVWFVEPRLVFSSLDNGSGGPLFHDLGIRIGGGFIF